MKANYFIYGHESRNALAKELARKLPFEGKNDNEIFFVVKNSVNMFRGYKGQPVVIWEDFTAESLKLCFGQHWKNIFDTEAEKPFELTDRGNVPLDVVNIITGPQHCSMFFNVLASSKKNLVDVTRRFSVLAEVRADGYDTLVNTGYCQGGDFTKFQRVFSATLQ